MKNDKIADFSETKFSMGDIDVIFYFGSLFNIEEDKIHTDTLVHEHAMYEVHCVTKGQIKVKSDDKIFTIKQNEALFIPPYKYHMSYSESDDSKYVKMSFEIKKNTSGFNENLYDSLVNVLNRDEIIKLEKTESLSDLTQKLIDYANVGGYPANCWVNNILTSLLFRLYEILSDGKLLIQDNKKEFEDVLEKRNYLLDIFTTKEINNLSLDEVSEKIFLNKKQINRILKKRYNMTYKQKQIRFRIENAKKLLKDYDYSIDKISEMVGYTNLTSFYKAFKTIVGKTPSEYRKSIKNGT